MSDVMPLCTELGMTLDEMTADRVVMSVEWQPRLCTTSGLLHVGSTTIVVETDVRRASDDKLVAKVTQTQIVLRVRA